MQITINIPDETANQLQIKWHNLSRRVLEILVADAYRQDIINVTEVQTILNLPSRFAVDTFLKEQGVYIDYTPAQVKEDIINIKEVCANGNSF